MVVEKPELTGAAELAEDRRLVEAAQADRLRFADLYEKNFHLVYAYIVRRVNDRSAAEDLTSEVFQKALEYMPKYVWRGVPFAAWLFRIATNIIVDRAKQATREKGIAEQEDATEMSQFSLEEVEETARVFKLVDQLPVDQRRVIALRFADGRSIREIATELGRTEGAIKQLQFRGLQTLREELNRIRGKAR